MGTRHDNLPKAQGKLLADRRLALYRDESGILHALSSVYPHRSCDVERNGTENVWDCLCHDSRFAPDGAVLRGPAARLLGQIDVLALPE